MQNFSVLKPFWVAFGHLFPLNKKSEVLIREGEFIRINMVCIYIYYTFKHLPLDKIARSQPV